MMKVVAVVSLVLVLVLVARPGEAITCEQVTHELEPCVPYLTQGGTPSSSCCSGVKNLGSIPTQQDRRTACNCVKSAAGHFPNLKPDAATSLPGRCGVSLPFPISSSTNCNSIP
ncbi:non-specific lipid-transfer protein A-like [Coffea eugenioides]|uniref:non-specific lipid-transfer protein A-like n=1 Tax=Coffea eugenioides TaxID=49369 RepID=UPI000F5CCFD3|nr:non-specific lipid-transfer protein A-like [Coffea arabica]XP_027154336.1 non-specific lipid-transfer protein A-like [Coffea eugenioides]